MFITVKYSCKQCGLVGRDVIVPERKIEDDVVKYLELTVMDCVGADHRRVSPYCRATEIQDLMIPIKEDTPIGVNPN